MNFIISPTYRDLFSGEKPRLKDLLKDIPSKASLALLCSINSKIFISKNLQTQFEIFHSVTMKVSRKEKDQILMKLADIQAKDLKQEIRL